MRLRTTISVVILVGLASFWTRPTATAYNQAAAHDTRHWRQNYDAGYTDARGIYAGGSEIMHLPLTRASPTRPTAIGWILLCA